MPSIVIVVSIHVPLAEHDGDADRGDGGGGVSIHVPLAEHDDTPDLKTGLYLCFNSRAPRGARHCQPPRPSPASRFNSRAPRGARHMDLTGSLETYSFNSRAPRGARQKVAGTGFEPVWFQFTCPSRSTTGYITTSPVVRLQAVQTSFT